MFIIQIHLTVWTQEAVSSIGNAVTIMLGQRDNDGILAADTHGKGIYTTLVTSALPVELTSFSGIFQNGKVKLLWLTETEVSNYGFNVGFIEGHGNSNSQQSNKLVNESVMYGKHYYRLKQIDNNGSFEYYDVIDVDVPTLKDYSILQQNYPNPFNPGTKIQFTVNDNTNVYL